MPPKRNPSIPAPPPIRLAPSRDALRGLASTEISWDKWSRHVESRRRKLNGKLTGHNTFSSPDLLIEATYVSFRLEGLDVTESQTLTALTPGKQPRTFRSRMSQRLRNHAALLHEVDHAVKAAQPINPDTVLRWYTSISSGLCPADLSAAPMIRLTQLLQRINSPELRLPAAIQEITRLHASALADPLLPSFNGILARLLLRYHLERCDLPPILFHPETPPEALANPRLLLPLLMEQLEHSFDLLLA